MQKMTKGKLLIAGMVGANKRGGRGGAADELKGSGCVPLALESKANVLIST